MNAPETDIDPNTAHKDPAYGWVMVFVAFTLSAFSFGALSSISVFLKPLTEEFGWGRGQTSLGYSAIAFSSAIFGVLWGIIADRYGTRWFGVIAALAMTLALFLLSGLENIYQFYGFYFLFGALGNALCSTPLFANVGFWFKNNPGLALGITAAGGAIGQGIVPYLVGIAINQYGWQTAYQIMAASYLVVCLPIALLVRESPARLAARKSTVILESDFPLSEVEVITWISIAVIFCCNCMAVPIVHLIPLLTDGGASTEAAAQVFLVLMLAGGVGRIAGGKLGDLLGPLPTYLMMSLGQTVFVFWFPYMDIGPGLYLLAIVFGFTYSGVMSSILICTRMMVSARVAARAMSITSFFGWSGMASGGFVGGYLFDHYGNYDLAFSFASMAGVINLVILTMFFFRIRRAKQSIPVSSPASRLSAA